ncbi:MAG: RNA polymerase sigma factor [Planctomycetaceae bacterium]
MEMGEHNPDMIEPDLIEMVEQHSALLFRYAYRLTGSATEAEDLTQQTFLAAHTKLSQLRVPSQAKSWLCSILKNAYLKSRRSAAGKPLLTWNQHQEPATETVPEGPYDDEDVQQVLNDLPDEFKIPLILFYFQEMSYREIAEHLEIPVGTVMSRLARAKAAVRSALEQRAIPLTGGKYPQI